MDLSVENAQQFQEYVYFLFDLFKRQYRVFVATASRSLTAEHCIIIAIVTISSIFFYKLGKRSENNSYLTDHLKHRLHEFESEVLHVKARIQSNQKLLKFLSYFEVAFLGIAASFLCYQGYIDHTQQIMWIVAAATITLVIISRFQKSFLTKSIIKLNLRIKEDMNKQEEIMGSLLSEMTTRSRQLLKNIVSQQTVKEIEIEKETIRKLSEAKSRQAELDSKEKSEALKKRYEDRLNATIARTKAATEASELEASKKCTANICKKKKKLLKEKIKRNDWFVQNLSEFAWCSICASNMQDQQEAQAVLEMEEPFDPSFASLDDSIHSDSMIASGGELSQEATAATTTTTTEKSNETKVFQAGPKSLQRRNTLEDQIVCQNSCLTKYFYLCKRIGEKYNQWTDLIEKYQSKYSAEKKRIADLPINARSKVQRQMSLQQTQQQSIESAVDRTIIQRSSTLTGTTTQVTSKAQTNSNSNQSSSKKQSKEKAE